MATTGHPEHGHGTPLYGVVIHKCIAEGELDKMKGLVEEAERQLKQHGNVRAALEVLKAEIAKAEKKP